MGMNLFLRIFATGTIATTYAFTKIPDIASSNATCLPMYAECSHKNLGRAPCCPGTSCWEPTSNCPAGAKACCYRIPETPSDSKSSTLQTADTIPHWGPRQYPSPDHYAQAVESVLTGTAPGLYVKYDWDTSKSLSANIEVQHVWTTIPSGSDSNGNGVFASSQFWYHDKEGGTTAGGYLGSQAFRAHNGTGFYEKRVFIFSCWDVKNAKLGNATVGWTTPATCQRFGGEGVGSHCMLEYDTKPGVLYRFKLAFSGHNATGAFWTGTVTAGDTGEKTTVGTLFYPHLKGEIGFGNLGTYSNEFLEYFLGGDCDSDVHTGVGSFGPFFMDGKVEPKDAYPQYGNSECKRSVVHGCIPGFGCGKPRVWVQGGRGVVRNNTDATRLW